MDEIKQMLYAIHKENKDILSLLIYYQDYGMEYITGALKEIQKATNEKYDNLFLGKDDQNATD